MGWTKDQQKAIEHHGHNIIVSAGAGSGKTAVLSERVLEFVKSGYKVEEFLILTFTNLAAGEMKERIRDKLSKAKLEEANNVDTADICTFDSFASSIVKKYHYLLGLSPKLINIDSNVMSVKKRDILDKILNRYYEEHNPKFEKMIDALCFKNDEEIRKLILKIHSVAELEIDKNEFFDTFISRFYASSFIDGLVKEIEKQLFAVKSNLRLYFDKFPTTPRKKDEKRNFVDEMKEIVNPLYEANTYSEIVEAIYNISIPKFTPNEKDDGSSVKECREYFNSIKKEFIDKIPLSKEKIYEMFDRQKEFAEILIDITRELDIEQEKYKNEKQAFEFNDIAKKALELVKTNKDICKELKAKYKMIMIDEYQDTSLLQEEFISLISNNNVYMVGDIKQSIYAFRNARSDIFKGKYDKYKASEIDVAEAIDMKKNFRSRKEVLDDINLLFTEIMSDEIGGANYKKDHVIDFGNQDYEKLKVKTQNYASTFITYNIDGSADEKRMYEIDIIAKDIKEKMQNRYQIFDPGDKDKGIPPFLRDAKYSDFCILMDRGSMFEDYKKVFTKYNIPLYVENDEDIKDSIMVKILNNILVLISSSMKDEYESQDFLIAFLSINRSYLFQKTDKELYELINKGDFINSEIIKKVKEIIKENREESNYSLLEKVIHEFGVYQKLSLIGDVRQNEIYLDEFMKYFKQMSDLDYSIDQFIEYFKYIDQYNLKVTLSSSGTSLNSVKIMNIHKSKGLEFPVVYFSGLNAEFVKDYQKKTLNISPNFGLILCEDKRNILKFFNNRICDKELLSERIRLLYVALTRAREKMIFLLDNSLNEKKLEKVLSFVEIIFPYYSKFENYEYIEEEIEDKEEKETIADSNGNNDIQNKKEEIKFEIHEPTFSLERKEKTSASKDMLKIVSKEKLELGTRLHKYLEVIDFYNPDFSIISDDKEQAMIKKFFNYTPMLNVKNAKIFKEFEFINEDHHGIVDLMLIYDDHIDIIDYKTKNIIDEAYEKQLKTYRENIKKIMKNKEKPIYLYLYSLVNGQGKPIK